MGKPVSARASYSPKVRRMFADPGKARAIVAAVLSGARRFCAAGVWFKRGPDRGTARGGEGE